ERTITSKPKFGQKITVRTPTHIAAVMDFESGAVGTITTTFDVWPTGLPPIEIYGTEGSMQVPDPNNFGGVVRVRSGRSEWSEIPLTHGYAEQARGLGVADMAYALRSGRAHRASGEMAYHVLDVMHAFHDSSEQSAHVHIESRCPRPAPLPLGLRPGTLDA